MKTTVRGLDELNRTCRHLGAVGRFDDRVPGQIRKRVAVPGVVEAERASEPERTLVTAKEVNVGAVRGREHRRQQPDRAGADNEQPLAPLEVRGPNGAQGIPTRLDQRAHRVVDPVRQLPAAPTAGTATFSASAPGRPWLMPSSTRKRAHVVAPRKASITTSAAEHRVARHALANPVAVDTGADLADDAAPLVPNSQRIPRPTVVEVRHLARVELHVRAADTDSLHVDDDFARFARPAAARPARRPSCGPVITNALTYVS